jgi:hypothetical protein
MDNKLKILAVGGTFGNAKDVKKSNYVQSLFTVFSKVIYCDIKIINGGLYKDIPKLEDLRGYNIILWFPNIINSYHIKNIVNDIKIKYPKTILIISKNNRKNKYTTMHLIARSLKAKANLLVEFTEDWYVNHSSSRIEATILDPLGNMFLNKHVYPTNVGICLAKRTLELLTYTRIGSKSIGGAVTIPNKAKFFKLARDYGEKFHKLIANDKTDRFMGNLSFRCQKGFPSFKNKNIIYVSKRNIDKRHIDRNGFVGVRNIFLNDSVAYYGDYKPSIDTPIQIYLYNYFKYIKYMLHSHTYIKGAPFTFGTIPCGAIEEFEAIADLVEPDVSNFKINLKGHGCLIGCNNLKYMKDLKFIGRELPEDHSLF